jgi:uncharacterized protein YggU (UPF0235/DUF167 family)
MAVRLTIQAHPAARMERVASIDAATVGVWVRARPIDGQANTAIERALAAALGLRPRQVRIVAGDSGRRKIVEIDLPDQLALQSRLLAHGMRAN